MNIAEILAYLKAKTKKDIGKKRDAEVKEPEPEKKKKRIIRPKFNLRLELKE